MASSDYELILMLDPRLEDERREQLATDAKSRIEAKGELTNESPWGLRKMAYEIEQRAEADYRCYRFRGDNDLLDDLNHGLRITDGILRFRIFSVEAEAPMIVPPDTEQIMRRDESDDRGRGRGRRDDRGPRRPRGGDSAPESGSEPAPTAEGEQAPRPEAASAPEGEPASQA